MIYLAIVIAVCTLLSYIVERQTTKYPNVKLGNKNNAVAKIFYLLILVVLILFAGLRTKYNDTPGYLNGFNILNVNNFAFSDIFDTYGGFRFYQWIIKRFISSNAQWLLIISAALIVILYTSFIAKHSKYFSQSMFWFLIGDFVFSLAGLKQAISIAISLYVIEAYLNKKYVKSVILLLIAMSFHPYIICIACVPFLTKKSFDVKTLLIVAVIIFGFLNLELVFKFFGSIGKEYEGELTDNRMNPFRIVVKFIPIVIFFLARKQINESNNKLLILSVNMSVLGFALIFLGFFMDPVYCGRMALYFDVLQIIAVPYVVNLYFGEDNMLCKGTVYIIFAVFCVLDVTKLFNVGLMVNQFEHTGILSLFL